MLDNITRDKLNVALGVLTGRKKNLNYKDLKELGLNGVEWVGGGYDPNIRAHCEDILHEAIVKGWDK